jgi:predicted nucleotidyltransferase
MAMATNTVSDIRKRRQSQVIDSLRNDVDRLKKCGKLRSALLIGSYCTGTFDSASDIDLVCVVDHPDSPDISSSDFSLSDQKDFDLIFVSQENFSVMSEWAKCGVEL